MNSSKTRPRTPATREPVSLALGGIIREERLRRKWTPALLEEKSGISRQGITQIETNEHSARLDTTLRIARAFGLDASELLGRAERQARPWPARCRECNYCCIEYGRLKDLNYRTGCTRPAR